MRYPQPPNEDAFEEFCLWVLRRHWNCPTLERYAHRGEEQEGIDILDLGGGEPLRAGQCKHHGSDMTLPPKELRAEVEKAKQFRPALDHFAILTTAKKSAQTHKALLEINREHKKQGLFSVELLTWEGIERLLDEYPEIRARLDSLAPSVWQESLKNIHQQIVGIAPAVAEAVRDIIPSGEGSQVDAEIDEARNYIKAHNCQLARLLLNRIRSQQWDHLTARQRFRVTINTGAAHMGEGDFAEAGRLYIEGLAYQPNDLEAQAFEASGHELLGDRPRAYEKAGAVLTRLPTSSKAAAVRVRTASPTTTYSALSAEIQPAAINAEVAVALALRALHEGLFDEAEALADRATREAADWPVAWLVLGQVHFGRETAKLEALQSRSATLDKTRLNAARRSFDTAANLARKQTPPHPTLLDILLNRARLRALLEEPAARDDLDEAFRIAPDDPRVLLDYAGVLHSRHRPEEAISCLRKALSIQDQPHIRFMLARMLWGEKTAASKREATELFTAVAAHPEPFQSDAALYALQGFTERAAWDEAAQFVDAVSLNLPTATVAVLRGTLAQAKRDEDAARRYAMEAQSSVCDETAVPVVQAVAHLLTVVGLYAEAIPLWKRLHVPGHFSAEANSLILCALRTGQECVVLETCRSLREAGNAPPSVLEQEVQILEQNDPQQAAQRLQERLVTDPSDKVARLRLSLIGLRIGRADLVASEESDLPDVADVQPQWIRGILYVLQQSGDFKAALRYAYRGLRRYFDDLEAHQAYFYLMAPGTRDAPDLPPPTVVGPGSAVAIREEGSNEPVWFVIEDDIDCYSARNERRPEDPLAQRLVGKAIGESVVLAESEVKPRVGQIVKLLDKSPIRP